MHKTSEKARTISIHSLSILPCTHLAWWNLQKSIFCNVVIISKSIFFFSYQEQKEELKYDIEKATERIMDWKSHIVRATNQEKAKINILDNLIERQVLVVMDWAMKWLPRSYRETQAEWFGKKGVSWHVSAFITRPDNEEAEFDVNKFAFWF